MTSSSYDCSDPDQRAEGLTQVQRALSERRCVVIPTDTVYGIAADAFSPQAVATLLAAKGRGRSMPPPVLIPRIQMMDALADDISSGARLLAAKYWPGPLTLIFHAQPSLSWDLGETKGTVALRMPDDELATELLTITGPLAVSSANRTGQPAAIDAAQAREQLADSVEVYLEDGPRPANGGEALPSTIIDCTGSRLRVVRHGALPLEELRLLVPEILDIDDVFEEPVLEEPESAVSLVKDSAEDPGAAEKSEDAEDPETAEASGAVDISGADLTKGSETGEALADEDESDAGEGETGESPSSTSSAPRTAPGQSAE